MVCPAKYTKKLQSAAENIPGKCCDIFECVPGKLWGGGARGEVMHVGRWCTWGGDARGEVMHAGFDSYH